MRKYILLLLTTILFCSCKPVDFSPVGTSIYEEAVIEVSNSEKVILNAYYFLSSTMTVKDNCEFFTVSKKISSGENIEAVFARHCNFSLKLGNDWYLTVRNAVAGKREFYDVGNDIDMSTQFFRVYSIKVGAKEVFRNEEALSDTYWSQWLIDRFEPHHYISVSLRLNKELGVELMNISKTKEPENFRGLLNTGDYQ